MSSLSPERRVTVLKRKAWTFADSNRPEEALGAIDEAIELLPEDPLLREEKVLILNKVGQREEALAAAKDGGDRFPQAARFPLLQGKILRKLGRSEEAASAFEAALELDEGLTDALGELGNAMAEAGRFDEALSTFTNLIVVCPNDAEAHLCQGLLLAKVERFKEGYEAVERSIKIDPKLLEAYLQRARILRKWKKLEAAQEAAAEAVKLTPRYVEGYVLAADIAIDRGDLELAGDMASKAQGLDEADPNVWRIKSVLHARGGRMAAAAVCRGLHFLCNGDGAAALIEMESAIEIDPQLVHGWHNKGKVLEAMGKFEAAEKAYRQALAVEDRLPTVYFSLGLMLSERMDRRDDALPILQRGVSLDSSLWRALPSHLQKRVNKPAYW
ncbi:MAG: tetratricopeptide repeat protein [Planctomycetota bacterium]|jgi:tetratricopeptide (TPR) repeat protein